MPIYEYRCSDCGAYSELLQGVTMDEVPVKCSSCGGTNLVRLISRHAVIHKKNLDSREGSCCKGESKKILDCVPGSCCGRYTIGE